MTDPSLHHSRYRPETGPRILFFSGGTALNDTASCLKTFTHNSAHLITPFDSGGSSQVLRQAFDMPAVGDLRSRLVALADKSNDVTRLMSHRLPKSADRNALQSEFRRLLDGSHPLMSNIGADMRDRILGMLGVFAQRAPANFDFRYASVGNLILAGGYFAHDRSLEPVLAWMSKTIGVLGTVRPIADVNLQIGVDLVDGTQVIGQACFTGKETPPISSPIDRVFMVDEHGEVSPDRVPMPKANARLIESADLICFTPGSLYSSVIANLLPLGVGRAVANRAVPKIYIPSLGRDPECYGMSLSDQVGALLSALWRDAGQACSSADLISLVVSSSDTLIQDVVDQIAVDHGIGCQTFDVTNEAKPDRYDPERLCRVLMSLV